MSLIEPIVEGACHDKAVGDVADCLVPTDPREVVAELRAKSVQWEPPGEVCGEGANLRAGYSYAFDEAADLVASKLLVER